MRSSVAVTALALVAAGCGGSHTRALGCDELPGTPVAIADDNSHVPYVGSKHAPYTSIPPTSGPHTPFTVAQGPYRSAIPHEIQVHALEHGHVVVQYAPTLTDEEVDRIEDLARRYPRDVIVAPHRAIATGIVMTAWGRIERLREFDERRAQVFVGALAGRFDHGWRDGASACS